MHMMAWALSLLSARQASCQHCDIHPSCCVSTCRYLNSVAKTTCKSRTKISERWIQLVLTVASAACFFLGNCMGWVWVRIKV